MTKDNVFFAKEGEKGLTETSAAHLCAVAANLKEEAEQFLSNVSFLDTVMGVAGTPTGQVLQTTVGYTEKDLQQVTEKLDRVAFLNGFISWFAEARKYLENYKKERSNISLSEWAKEVGITLPEPPGNYSRLKVFTLQEMIDEMNVSDRQLYLALEARAAVLGKFIHPDGALNQARDDVHHRLNKPISTSGSGRDTLVYRYSPSVDVKLIDEKFLAIQAEYRSIEQSLNHMKSDLRKKLEARNTEESIKYAEALNTLREQQDKYNHEYQEVQTQYHQYLTAQQTELSKIRFRIPEAYASLITELNNLGK